MTPTLSPKQKIIKLRHKTGRVFEGTALQCAEEMKEDAERSRLAYEDLGQRQPLPPHWLFEEFCKTNSLNYKWYPTKNKFELGFYIISEKV